MRRASLDDDPPRWCGFIWTPHDAVFAVPSQHGKNVLQENRGHADIMTPEALTVSEVLFESVLYKLGSG